MKNSVILLTLLKLIQVFYQKLIIPLLTKTKFSNYHIIWKYIHVHSLISDMIIPKTPQKS